MREIQLTVLSTAQDKTCLRHPCNFPVVSQVLLNSGILFCKDTFLWLKAHSVSIEKKKNLEKHYLHYICHTWPRGTNVWLTSKLPDVCFTSTPAFICYIYLMGLFTS